MCQPKLLHLPPTVSPLEKLRRNHRRSQKLTGARRKNLRYHPQVDRLCAQVEMYEEDARIAALPYLQTYRKNLVCCASNSLYRKLHNSREATLVTALVCSHRLCNVCNMMRARKLRRKWRAFLNDVDRDVQIRKAQRHFFTDAELIKGRTLIKVDTDTGEITERREEGAFTSGAEILRRFDLMHLTLTVPHSGGKWNGKDYYARELLQKFNEMRKAKWWVETVFGGEYSVETTKTENGLHIHIHALLFVDKNKYRSRNFLQVEILKRWNALTVDDGNNTHGGRSVEVGMLSTDGSEIQPGQCHAGRSVGSSVCFTLRDTVHAPLSSSQVDGLRKGFLNADGVLRMTEDGFQALATQLDARGSTLIGIKPLFFEIRAGQAHQYKSAFQQGEKWYAYASGGNLNSVLKGVTECLKYHFEPCALEDDDGNIDGAMLCQMLPNIYRQRLYGKFGGFYGIKALNVVEDPLSTDDLMQEAAENASTAYDPRTGAPMEPSEYFYAVADSRRVTFHDVEPWQYLSDEAVKRRFGSEMGLGGAIRYLAEMGVSELVERSREEKHAALKDKKGAHPGLRKEYRIVPYKNKPFGRKNSSS